MSADTQTEAREAMEPGTYTVQVYNQIGLLVKQEMKGYLTEVLGFPVGVGERTGMPRGENGWYVTELTTGAKITPWPHKSRKQALHAAEKYIEQQGGPDAVREAIEQKRKQKLVVSQ